MKTFILSIGLILLTPVAIAGHHLNGTWKLNVTLPGQPAGTATFELTESEGGALSGTYTGAAGTAAITGTVQGAIIVFSFDSQIGKVTYKGTYTDGKLAGKCTYGDLGECTFEGGKS